MAANMKTALVYDWFGKVSGGGEKVVQAALEVVPSDLFCLLKDEKNATLHALQRDDIRTSFIQRLPFAKTLYPRYLPFFPLAIEQLDVSSYDLVLSISHCVAKGVLTHADQKHLCYCFTPMRYAWDLYHEHLSALPIGVRGIARLFLHYLRGWDQRSGQGVDAFAAISHHVARRIEKTYGKKSTVIYPPVDTNAYVPGSGKRENFFVAASRMVPYKKMELIVEAFSELPEERLVVIGEGPMMHAVKAKAKKNIEIIGHAPDAVLRSYLQQAKGFVFAALEDFGILPVEAQSCGTPVIAYGRGGAAETVVHGKTGLHFGAQTKEAIIESVRSFSPDAFDAEEIRRHAETFSYERFHREFAAWIRSMS